MSDAEFEVLLLAGEEGDAALHQRHAHPELGRTDRPHVAARPRPVVGTGRRTGGTNQLSVNPRPVSGHCTRPCQVQNQSGKRGR